MNTMLYQSMDLVVHYVDARGEDLFIEFGECPIVTYREKSKESFAIIEENYLKYGGNVVYIDPSIKEQIEGA